MPESTSTLWMILFLLAAGAVGYLFWQLRQQKGGLSPGEQAKLHGYDALKAERDAERARADDLAMRLAAESARAAERDEAHKAARADLEKTFENVAQRALGQSQQSFLTLAKETFEKHQQAAAGGVKELVAPVQDQFNKLSETIAALDKSRT
ncbi:MAG TPA: hypothetical protein VG735_03665, partial [Caulobacterales bacterium]|nr:hypothetical protein [Caulobacterales bacterium]